MAKGAAAYALLAGLGVGILVEYVPDIFDLTRVSALRLLVLAALLVFVAAPLVAVGYIGLSLLIEGLVTGAGWVIQASFRAVVRLIRRIFHGHG